MSSLGESRQEIKRLRRAATRKISRIRRTFGAELTGTQYDPRRAPRKEMRYTGKQLEKYADSLREFLSRSKQFQGLASGKPVPREKWRTYERKENSLISQVAKAFEAYQDIPMPIGDETIGQRMEKMKPRHRHMMNRSVNSPWKLEPRSPRGISSPSALDRLISELDKKTGSDYKARQIASAREQFSQMMEITPNGKKYIKQMNKLSDEQFYIAWSFTSLADSTSLNYEIMMQMLDKGERAFHESVMRNETNNIETVLNWAKKL